jgi:hypothetical protein
VAYDAAKQALVVAGARALAQSPALAFAADVAALAGADEAVALKNRLVP